MSNHMDTRVVDEPCTNCGGDVEVSVPKQSMYVIPKYACLDCGRSGRYAEVFGS